MAINVEQAKHAYVSGFRIGRRVKFTPSEIDLKRCFHVSLLNGGCAGCATTQKVSFNPPHPTRHPSSSPAWNGTTASSPSPSRWGTS